MTHQLPTTERSWVRQPRQDRSWRFSLLDMMIFTTVVGVHLAAYLSVFRELQAVGNTAPFFVGLMSPILGLVISLIIKPLRARRFTRSALFRLPLETHWPVWIAGTFLPPFVVLGTNILIGNRSAAPSVAWLICSFAFLVSSTMLAILAYPRGSIYLCETGVVLKGSHHVPWSRMRFRGWDQDVPGRIRIRSGWLQAAVLVPPEQREAIEALLREKLKDWPN